MRKYKSVKWGKKEERSCSKRWGRIKKNNNYKNDSQETN